jgi:Lrp/AsnC family transcriptional regulator, regulator for asnA, asnC and gidA
MAHTPGTAVIPGGESSDGSRRSRSDRPDRAERHDRPERYDRPDRHDRLGRDRGRNGSRIVLDEISKRIIEQLQQDGRRSYAAIGKVVGLSEAAVRQRVQRLVDGGVMQIVAVTDPMTLGFHRQTMIGIKCEGDLERVADHLAGMDEIDYVVITSGSFDLLVEVVCEDDDQLLEILSRVRMAPTVTSTETFVYLKLRKQTYSWGTR